MHAELVAIAAPSGDDERRARILEQVPVHREIVAAWADRQASVRGN